METTKTPSHPASKHRSATAVIDEFEPSSSPVGRGGAAAHQEEVLTTSVPPPPKRRLVAAAVVAVVLLIALLLVGLLPRLSVDKSLATEAEAALNAPIPVNIIKATRGPAVTQITLPATLRPWQEVSLFARSTGYLKKFDVDISDHVKAGQLMAEIDSPEVDQQLLQAKAALLQAQAAVKKSISDQELAQVTYDRYKKLLGVKSVTQQDVDEKQSTLAVDVANLAAANANVAAALANVQRLTDLQHFEKFVAPFAGVVTGRTYDVGALILADPTDVNSKPMFKIAENDILRVFVDVPQSSALEVHKGMQVKVTSRQTGNQVYTGIVMGTTNYLDPNNRSLLTEVKVINVRGANGDFELLPGMYVQVSFEVHHQSPPWVIPAPALVINSDGPQVAIVRDNKVHFVKVGLGDDFGNTIEIVKGLKGDERIIATPGERTAEGAAVKPIVDKAE